MYDSFPPKCLPELICCHPANVFSPVRRTQFRLPATRTVLGLDQYAGFFLYQPVLHFLVSRDRVAGLPGQRDQVHHAF